MWWHLRNGMRIMSRFASVFPIFWFAVAITQRDDPASLVQGMTAFAALYGPYLTAIVAGSSIKRGQQNRRTD